MAKSFEELVVDLGSPDAALAAHAARELGKLHDRRAAGPLLEMLKHSAAFPFAPDNRLRAGAAAAALGDLGRTWAKETGALVTKGPGEPAHDRVQSALRDWGLSLLASAPPATRQRVVEEWLKRNPSGLPSLFQWLQTRPDRERLWFAEALGRLGGPQIAEGLVAMLVREDGSLDLPASVGLGHMGYVPAIPRLVAALDSAELREIEAAAGALGTLGAAAGEALPRLYLLAAETPDAGARRAVQTAVRLIEEQLRSAPAELEAASMPQGRGTEPEAAVPPAGRGTEPEAASAPAVTGTEPEAADGPFSLANDTEAGDA